LGHEGVVGRVAAQRSKNLMSCERQGFGISALCFHSSFRVPVCMHPVSSGHKSRDRVVVDCLADLSYVKSNNLHHQKIWVCFFCLSALASILPRGEPNVLEFSCFSNRKSKRNHLCFELCQHCRQDVLLRCNTELTRIREANDTTVVEKMCMSSRQGCSSPVESSVAKILWSVQNCKKYTSSRSFDQKLSCIHLLSASDC